MVMGSYFAKAAEDMDGFDEEAECKSTTPTKSRAEGAARGDLATKSRAERAEGDVERGNHTKRIHDRNKRKVFYHAKRGKRRTQKAETKFQGLGRDARNAATPRKKPGV